MPIEYIPHPIKADVNDVTGARALCAGALDFTNVYQNVTLRPIMCLVTVICFHAAAADYARGLAYIGITAAPNDNEGVVGHFASAPPHPARESTQYMLTWIVPPGYYYRVVADTRGVGGSTVGLNVWNEVEM